MAGLLLRTTLAATSVAFLSAAPPPAEVIGTGPLFHIVSDVDKSAAFYRGLLGVAAPTSGSPRTFAADPELQQLYNLPGGREAAAVVRIPGLPISLEFVEWRDVDRKPAQPRLQDPGASMLVLSVRDAAKAAEWLAQSGATIITPGGKPMPVEIADQKGRALFARDPEGFFIEIIQPDAAPGSTSPATNIVGAMFAVSVDNLDKTMRFYRETLGFHFEESGSHEKDRGWAAAAGLASAGYRWTAAVIPGTEVCVQFVEFKNIDRRPVRSRIQDPGTSMLQPSVRNIEATVQALKAGGAVVITAGGGSTLRHGNPISLLNGLDNFYLEPMQAGAPAR
jgi:catechol 2,3-dioxygenase-like lactoylglutathione lyase family enzyme